MEDLITIGIAIALILLVANRMDKSKNTSINKHCKDKKAAEQQVRY